jgi:tetratricopeptide (TPR) repeat protein
MKILDLRTAASHIKQACDENRESKWRSPFFFMVGAGISHPPVPLASDIEAECKEVALKYGRMELPAGKRALDTYSHWFGTAFPQPIQRQRYLRKLIEGKQISHANLRLAHLLLEKTISNLVVTPNFDDLLSRALTLFGRQHIICDHPNTVERIDPEADDLQLVHVHGTYWFYDCCNLQGELRARANPSIHTNLTMASLLDSILAHRSPLVIGYAGWDGDVLMQALERRLQTRLPFNLYWFCYRMSSMDSLPEWLKSHEDVCIVVPSQTKQETAPEGDVRIRDSQTGEQPEVADSVATTGFSAKEIDSTCLPAQQVLDELIQSFALKAPDLTVDPLTFFAKHLKSSLPHGSTDRPEGEIYFINSVIIRIEQASSRENESLQHIETQLEAVRDALRRSQYKEGIDNAVNIRIQDLSESQLSELSSALLTAMLGLDDLLAKLDGHSLQIALVARLLKFRPEEEDLEVDLANALVGKGSTLAQLNRHDEALTVFNEVLDRFAQRRDVAFQRIVSAALTWTASIFNMSGRTENALATYDEISKRYIDSTEPYLLERVAKSFIDKGNALHAAGRSDEALAAFEEILTRFGERSEGLLPFFVARALVRKGVALDSLDRTTEALESYESVERRFGASDQQALSIPRREAFRRLGQRLLTLNRPIDAANSFQKAVQIEPKDVAARTGIGNALRATGQYERAIETFRSILAEDPISLLPNLYLADSQFDLGKYQEAKASLERVIELRPQDSLPYSELAELYRDLGEFDDARETCKRGELEGVDSNRIRYQQALIEMEAQNYPEALKLLDESVGLTGTSLGLRYNAEGKIYTRLHQLTAASEAYSKAIENGLKTGHLGLGNVRLIAGDLGEAESILLKAFRLLPTLTGPRFRLAILYGITNRQDAAEKMLRETVDLFPQNMRPTRVLRRATALAGIGKIGEAISDVADLQAKVPKLSVTLLDFWDDLALMARARDGASGIEEFRVVLQRSLGLVAPSDSSERQL